MTINCFTVWLHFDYYCAHMCIYVQLEKARKAAISNKKSKKNKKSKGSRDSNLFNNAFICLLDKKKKKKKKNASSSSSDSSDSSESETAPGSYTLYHLVLTHNISYPQVPESPANTFYLLPPLSQSPQKRKLSSRSQMTMVAHCVIIYQVFESMKRSLPRSCSSSFCVHSLDSFRFFSVPSNGVAFPPSAANLAKAGVLLSACLDKSSFIIFIFKSLVDYFTYTRAQIPCFRGGTAISHVQGTFMLLLNLIILL